MNNFHFNLFFFQLLCIIVSNKEDVNAFANYVDDGSSHSDRSATPSPPQVQSAQG